MAKNYETVRKPKAISESDKNYLFSLSPENITLDLLKEFFAFRKNNKPRFNTNDTFILPKGKLYNEKQERTTVGRYIYNLLVLCPDLIKLLGYQNIPMGKKGIKSVEKKLSNYLLEEKITSQQFSEYFDKLQWLGFSLVQMLNSSMTYNLLQPNANIEKKKKELVEKYKTAIENNDIIAVSKLEKELIKFAEEELNDEPGKMIYDSGGRGSFGNNYKNTSLLRGGLKNLSDPDKIATISTKSLVDGIPAEEMEYYADMITQASYNRAVGTREGGLTKNNDSGSPCKNKSF